MCDSFIDKHTDKNTGMIRLIEGDGTFNADGLDNFIKQVELGDCGLSYGIVSIIGPQSSGKSTLLNHLFHTNFREMDAEMGRTQTTKGIWMARCTGIEPCTIVMDLEGTDGKERGEDDTTFEKQSALFAIAVSNIVLINIWCHDIGREHAANIPLLKTVVQVMLRLFKPRKTTFMFVIRDKTRTPLKKLEDSLSEDIQKIWDSVSKAEAHKNSKLRDFINVKVVALASYEYEEEEFKKQVASMRQEFFQFGSLAGGDLPALDFSLIAQKIWKLIRENKDLDLPSHKIQIATVRCEDIAKEIYSSFLKEKDWIELEEAVKSQLVSGFGKRLSSLLSKFLSSYDEDSFNYEESVRSAKRKQLKENLKHLIQPAYQLMSKHIRSETFDEFKTAFTDALNGGHGFAMAACNCTNIFMRLFDERCEDAISGQVDWDFTKIRAKFSSDLFSCKTEVRTVKLHDLTTRYESKFRDALCSEVEALLSVASDETWPSIRTLFYRETRRIMVAFSSDLSSFGMDTREERDMISKLTHYARGLVEEKARRESGNAIYLMRERFKLKFNYDNNSNLRDWTENKDIPAIAETAKSCTLKLLSVLAAIRLDVETDTIWDKLKEGTSRENTTLLASYNTWEEDPGNNTLITLLTPVHCKSLWDKFIVEITPQINSAAIILQEANERRRRKIVLSVVCAVVMAHLLPPRLMSEASLLLNSLVSVARLLLSSLVSVAGLLLSSLGSVVCLLLAGLGSVVYHLLVKRWKWRTWIRR